VPIVAEIVRANSCPSDIRSDSDDDCEDPRSESENGANEEVEEISENNTGEIISKIEAPDISNIESSEVTSLLSTAPETSPQNESNNKSSEDSLMQETTDTSQQVANTEIAHDENSPLDFTRPDTSLVVHSDIANNDTSSANMTIDDTSLRWLNMEIAQDTKPSLHTTTDYTSPQVLNSETPNDDKPCNVDHLSTSAELTEEKTEASLKPPFAEPTDDLVNLPSIGAVVLSESIVDDKLHSSGEPSEHNLKSSSAPHLPQQANSTNSQSNLVSDAALSMPSEGNHQLVGTVEETMTFSNGGNDAHEQTQKTEKTVGTGKTIPKSEVLKPFAFLLPTEYILRERNIPSFSDASKILVPVTDWDKAPLFIFLSHRWPSPSTFDDELHTYASVLFLFLKSCKISYIWIDYTCIDKNESLTFEHFSTMITLISKAARVLVMPFTSKSLAIPPSFDLEAYSRRAWCAFEYCIYMKTPSSVRIANIVEKDKGHNLELIGLPTNKVSIGIEHLLDGMLLLKSAVQTNDKSAFTSSFRVSEPGDIDRIWEALRILNSAIFSYQRTRDELFVKSTSAGGAHGAIPSNQEVYDEDARTKMAVSNTQQAKAPEERRNECKVNCSIS